MAGQIAQVGAQAAANYLAGNVAPYVGGSAPTWIPGLVWINSSDSYAEYSYNQSTSAWSKTVAPSARYIALLTYDPVVGGAVLVSDLVELSIGGYARQSVDFGNAPAAYPGVVSNTNVLTFGPISTTMTTAVQWAALVTSPSGVTGDFLMSWAFNEPTMVNASQNMQVGIGQLVIQAA